MQYRHILDSFKEYVWESSNEEISNSTGIDINHIRRFDTNTSPYRPTHWLKKLSEDLPNLDINQYPDTSYTSLRKKLSNYIGVDRDRIVVANGADEAFDIISKTYLDQGFTSIESSPTYSYYRIITELNSSKLISIPRKKNFSNDVDAILNNIGNTTQIIYLCSPNNPTGNSVDRNDILRILNETKSNVVIDEAYQEYGGESFIDLTEEYDNLLIVKTLSKAFALAGARIGYIVGCKRAVDLLNKVRPPNSLNVISLRLAEFALDDVNWTKRKIKIILKERDRCMKEINHIKNVKTYPSDANFFLIEFLNKSSESVCDSLIKKGLVLRKLKGHPVLENCLRFSVGLPKHNDEFLVSLQNIMDNHK